MGRGFVRTATLAPKLADRGLRAAHRRLLQVSQGCSFAPRSIGVVVTRGAEPGGG